jgi:hypothetical protein
VYLLEPNAEDYELDPMAKFYAPRHVYAQHQFLKGQVLTASDEDIVYITGSCPPEAPDWKSPLDCRVSDNEQDLLWQEYRSKIATLANV